jgi:Fe2+ transport system protein B
MMKNTIKNTVSEVYKKVNNNYSFNRDLLNNNDTNTTSKNQYKNTNSNKKRIINTSADILKTNFNKQNNSMYIFLILFLVFLFIIAIGLFFKESIINFFKELFKNEEDQEKIKELEDTIRTRKKEFYRKE